MGIPEVGHHFRKFIIHGHGEGDNVFEQSHIGEGQAVGPENGFCSWLGLLRIQMAVFNIFPLTPRSVSGWQLLRDAQGKKIPQRSQRVLGWLPYTKINTVSCKGWWMKFTWIFVCLTALTYHHSTRHASELESFGKYTQYIFGFCFGRGGGGVPGGAHVWRNSISFGVSLSNPSVIYATKYGHWACCHWWSWKVSTYSFIHLPYAVSDFLTKLWHIWKTNPTVFP